MTCLDYSTCISRERHTVLIIYESLFRSDTNAGGVVSSKWPRHHQHEWGAGLNRCSDNFNFCPSCKNSHRSVNQNGFHENNASFQKNIVRCSRACRCVVWCVWTLRKRFRKKYVYPRPQIPWYGDLLGKEQISELWGNNTIQFNAKEHCATFPD